MRAFLRVLENPDQANNLSIRNFGFLQNDNLANYIGGAASNQNDLLTNAHYDSEYYTLVKIYWMKSHLLEIKNDHTGCINVLNEIMKEIDDKYGKNNPIYTESSKKKGEAILKLSHSVHKQGGYSDLSTNSRSSLNNTFVNKHLLSPSKASSAKRLKRYPTDSTHNSTRRKSVKLREFDKLNKDATRLIERSIIKQRVELTPQRNLSTNRKLDFTGAKLTKPKIKIRKDSIIKKVKHSILPFPVANLKTKKRPKRKISLSITKRRNPKGHGNSLQVSMDKGNSLGGATFDPSFQTPNSFQTRFATLGNNHPSFQFGHTYHSSFGITDNF